MEIGRWMFPCKKPVFAYRLEMQDSKMHFSVTQFDKNSISPRKLILNYFLSCTVFFAIQYVIVNIVVSHRQDSNIADFTKILSYYFRFFVVTSCRNKLTLLLSFPQFFIYYVPIAKLRSICSDQLKFAYLYIIEIWPNFIG